MISKSIEIKTPLVAILGRPNVGKSTLYNRFLGRRRAITDPTPGVTRDTVEASWFAGGHEMKLADTGGLTSSRNGFDPLVTGRSLATAERADLILLVMDVTEVTLEDEEFLSSLQPYRDKVVLVVNKVDNPQREQAAWNYYQYGFEYVVPISAEHGLNISALLEVVIERISALEEHAAQTVREARAAEPAPGAAAVASGSDEGAVPRERVDPRDEVKLAILGQPNTGKSTLLNAITDSELSIVSDIPGTTRDVVEGKFLWKGRPFRILDTAGIRRKSKVREDVEYYSVNRAISTISESDVVLLLIDAEKGLTDQDKKIANLVVERGRGIILVLNKWDLTDGVPNQFQAVKDRIEFVFPILHFAPVLPLSALKHTGFEKLLDSAAQIHSQLNHRVETGKLNQRLAGWVEETPPPSARNVRWKIRYMTQTRTNPVEFVLFVNRTKKFPESYLGYIRNKIRRELGFSLVPFRMELRDSSR